MNIQATESVRSYVDSISELFDEIESWSGPMKLNCERREILIGEEASGDYSTHTLLLEDRNGRKIAEFLPAGAFVIGWEGRVDLIGMVDNAVLVRAESAPPPPASEEEASESLPASLYREADQPGWYWLERRKRGKARLLDEELFAELLAEVSDYRAM